MTEETQAVSAAGAAGAAGTSSVHEQVVGILNEVLQLELSPQTEDIDRAQVEQWDSVNHLRLVMELEQAFSVALSDDDVLTMQSLRQIEVVLSRHHIAGTFAPTSG